MHPIVTKRLFLAPTRFVYDRINQQVDWLNDPENVRYSEQRHKKHTFGTQYDYLRDAYLHDKVRFYEVNHGDVMVGTITATIDSPNSVADIGILIGRSFWGNGFGLEAWAGLCDHLLNNGTRKVEAGMMANNFGMIGICRKYGMTQEGRKYDHFLFGEELVDATYFGKGL